MTRPSSIFAWPFAVAEDLEPWRTDGCSWRLGDEGAELEPRAPLSVLERAVELDAEIVDTLTVETRGFFHTVELRWTGRTRSFEEEGVLATAQRRPDAGNARLFRFELGDHAGWTGRVGKIRLTFRTSSKRRFVVDRISATRDVLSPTLLRDAAQRPWKLELGHEVKNVLLALPNQPIERRLLVPPRAELRFSCGVPETIAAPVHFRVVAIPADRERQTLFEHTSTPVAPGEDAAWWEGKLDLSSLAGQQVRLLLETETGIPLTPDTGFPAWANVDLLHRRPGPAPPNVVLISIDTLRADRLSVYGHERPTSPNIDAWARRSAVVFERTVAPSPWTLPSHVSMFSGLDAHRHGVNGFDAAPRSLTLLAEILRQERYATAAVTGGGLLHPRFGLTQGFDVFYADRQGQFEQELPTGLDRALTWLDANRERPFFLFLHTYEVHAPFIARQPWFSRWSRHDPELTVIPWAPEPEDVGQPSFTYRPTGDGSDDVALPPELASLPSDLYDSAVAFVDAEIERLFTWLRANDLERRTVVILTSDHGEMLGEHGLANHAYLYDENLLVPLIIATPDGQGAGRRVAEQVRLIDLLPTVLELIGLPVPSGIDGLSLASLIEGEKGQIRRPAWSYAARSRRGLSLRLDNRLKYVRRITALSPEHGQERLFDLVNDPHEEHDLLSAGNGATPVTSPSIETLRELMQTTWKEQSSGARLSFDNPGSEVLHGTLQGQASAVRNLKALDLPCPCVTVENDLVAFRVPPGVNYTLAFESWRSDGHGIFLRVAEGDQPHSGFSFSADVTAPQVATRGHKRWRRVDPEQVSPGAPRITLQWQGNRQLETAAAPLSANDQELARSLRALGYLP